jgi:hypothetical protein
MTETMTLESLQPSIGYAFLTVGAVLLLATLAERIWHWLTSDPEWRIEHSGENAETDISYIPLGLGEQSNQEVRELENRDQPPPELNHQTDPLEAAFAECYGLAGLPVNNGPDQLPDSPKP